MGKDSALFGDREKDVKDAIVDVLVHEQTLMNRSRDLAVTVVRTAFEETLRESLIESDRKVYAYHNPPPMEKKPVAEEKKGLFKK
jgi:DNA-nicking Smr family endonuclease